jgi:hypothetical protein
VADSVIDYMQKTRLDAVHQRQERADPGYWPDADGWCYGGAPRGWPDVDAGRQTAGEGD